LFTAALENDSSVAHLNAWWRVHLLIRTSRKAARAGFGETGWTWRKNGPRVIWMTVGVLKRRRW